MKKKKNNLLSIDYDDDQEDYNKLNEFLKKDTQRKKNKTASVISEYGEEFLHEIDEKGREHELEKEILSDYIVKNSKRYLWKEKLMTYDISEVRNIYFQIKHEKRGFLVKFLEFINLLRHK